MKYISTRGGMQPQEFCDIVLGGLAPDGGLAMPESYPRCSDADLTAWRHLGYRELAFEILRRFATDIPEADLKNLIDKAYTTENFGSEDITPIKTLEPGLHLLGLSNGPTLAFKDIAMQFLGNLFEYVLLKRNEELNILGATSGDTGSAAEYAMKGKRGINVFMLSPYKKMSAFQTAQMFSLQDPNIFNIAVKGVFDDCQDIVKDVSNDLEFKAKYRIGTVNSINWARMLAQVVYYFKAYLAITKDNSQQVSFSVPSGNFGNVCAGHVARMMGLPIKQLIVATNENDVLHEFFKTGIYKVRSSDKVFQTSSPSMDISKASNFERFIFDLVDRNDATVKALWQQVVYAGEFDLRETAYFEKIADYGFVAGSSSHANRIDTIRQTWDKYGVMIDTHTADGLKVGQQYREKDIPLVCLETALPAKFESTILEALKREPERPVAYKDIEKLPQRFEVMNADVKEIKQFIVEKV